MLSYYNTENYLKNSGKGEKSLDDFKKKSEYFNESLGKMLGANRKTASHKTFDKKYAQFSNSVR